MALNLSTNGIFSVKKLSSVYDQVYLGSIGNVAVSKWLSCLPKKVNVFMWRLSLNNLPLRQNLKNRGIEIVSDVCPFCNIGQENGDCVFTRCRFITPIWRSFHDWWGNAGLIPNGVLNAYSAATYTSGSSLTDMVNLATRYFLIWRYGNGEISLSMDLLINELPF
ncbi:uncharacterized protein [Rutidosis leptorrhynchoides]|uniref:uncharacterized protein n=1 Tax=Rutidosis leptorrhynchoides TaxID=125765 RepID=UPI003A99AAF1